MNSPALLAFLGIITIGWTDAAEFYVCGGYPNQYYSDTPCTNLRPGDRCTNGGRYLGWGCASSTQCRYSAPAGIIEGVCAANICCTSTTTTTPNTQCPTGTYRTSTVCRVQSDCRSASALCRSGRCCLTLGRQRDDRGLCWPTEVDTGIACTAGSCPIPTDGSVSTCRSGRCCSRRRLQQCPTGGEWRANRCSLDNECFGIVDSQNELEVCDLGRCCVKSCPQGSLPARGARCHGVGATCAFLRNNAVVRGLCHEGICCEQTATQRFFTNRWG